MNTCCKPSFVFHRLNLTLLNRYHNCNCTTTIVQMCLISIPQDIIADKESLKSCTNFTVHSCILYVHSIVITASDNDLTIA